jgi:acyl carrier protein
MTKDEILAQLGDIIRETFRQDGVEITRETTALDVDGWDSLSHTMLLLDVETHFGVRLPSDRVYDLADVGELVDLIAETQAKA